MLSSVSISFLRYGLVLKTSALNESLPEALLFPRVAIAALISAFFGENVSISRSLQAGCLLGVCWMSAGCLLGVCWVSAGCLLDVCWVLWIRSV